MNETQPLPTDALLPCPFCGTQPTLEGDGQVLWITCPSDSECRHGGMAIGIKRDEKEAGIASWNRRTPAPVGAQAVARVNAEGFIVECGDLLLAPGLKLYTADQALSMGREPLDRDEIRTYARESLGDGAEEAGFYDGVRWAEEKHGIKQGGQHDE